MKFERDGVEAKQYACKTSKHMVLGFKETIQGKSGKII